MQQQQLLDPTSPLDVAEWCANNINQAKEVEKCKRINKYINRAIRNIQDDEDLLSADNRGTLLGSNPGTSNSQDTTTN
jgi:cell division protein FtsB